ncbi:putative ring finger [Lyophyllum shimeji]|uniref:E3 ubiquitin-protein ligase listerin n=1 Tax=Lyophyllum shimeji TaxID=47721 RepID=A0A9P3UPS5_LYOSH|nr:putative ring finger [Lyophyllum shimeji]
MAKGGKSSATSATRKKHAKKTAGPPQEEQPIPKEKKLTKKERAQKKKEPRAKAYIPPVKPAPVQPDPLETTGLIHSLPPELLVVLRSFNKKAQVTKIRALEELQSAWIDKCRKEGEDGALVYVLVEMVPVWLHHVPALFVHPSRRVRLLAAGVHLSFLQISPVRDQILFFIRETASPSQIESILGAWCLAAHDIDRSVSSVALKSWEDAISFESEQDRVILDDRSLPSLVSFIQRATLDPNEVYNYLNPAPPVTPVPPPKKGVRREEPEVAARVKVEDMEESEQDRKARLRISALGAIRRIIETLHAEPPEDILNFVKNPALWSSLHHAERCPFIDIESFGHGQHNVRKSAWALLQTLLSVPKARMEPLLPTLSVATLRSAWVEPDSTVHAAMWQPLLKFLKEFPNAWEIERLYDYANEEGAAEDAESEDSEAEGEKQAPLSKRSEAYQEFLRFLELGCNGSPLQGYPTVVIVVSTIPSSILASSSPTSPLADFFSSFWSALDSRALSSLQRSATSLAFLSSLLECMVFLVKRVRNDGKNHERVLTGSEDVDDFVRSLVREQHGKVWAHLADKTLKVERRAAARAVAQTLLALHDIDTGLFEAAWDTLSVCLRKFADSEAGLVSVFLKVSYDKFKHETKPREAVESLMSKILQSSAKSCKEALEFIQAGKTGHDETSSIPGVPLLVNMLDQFREGLFEDRTFAQALDDIMARYGFLLLAMSPSLILAYLTHRRDEGRSLELWHALLSGIAEDPSKAEHPVKPLLDAAQRGVLPRHLKPSSVGEVDTLIEALLAQVLAGDTVHTPFVRQVLQSPDYFVSEEQYSASLTSITSAFSLQVGLALSDPEISLDAFETSLDLIASISQHPPHELPAHDFSDVLPDVFLFAYLLPASYESQRDHAAFSAARDLWERWLKTWSTEQQDRVVGDIKRKLGEILLDTQVRPSPHEVLELVRSKPPGILFNLPVDMFPTPQAIHELLDQLSPNALHPSLAAVDSLVPPSSAFAPTDETPVTFDSRGFSGYARVVEALLQVFVEDRHMAKHNLWALRHFQALEVYAQDFINIPSVESPVFGVEAVYANLETLVSKVEQVTTYLFTSPADERWRQAALAAVLENKPSESLGSLSAYLVDAIRRSRDSDSARDSRILRNILQHIFHDVDKDEADRWILLARKLESTAPQTSMALVSAVTGFAIEPPRLDRYRNELAASLLGIPPSKANTEGLVALRKLAISAPNPDSDVVFLPQPRAVNVAKAFQQWIASDEDIDEEVESMMTLVFYHLAPILQDISGSHWDLIFDMMESNLEISSITDDTTLVTLARTLRLIILIQDLVLTNKALRASWQERRMPILTMVRDLATVSLDDLEVSVPRSTCRGLVLSIIQDLPPSLIDHETFSKMCHLVMDSSIDVQKMAYQFLQTAAEKRTEYLVIEAGVDAEAAFNATIPLELLDILQRSITVDELSMEPQNGFGYLLAWMLLFDLFRGSSLKVRSSYIEQLRNLSIIDSYFIPTIISFLQLDRGPLKVFKLGPWAVDDFHIEHYEPGAAFSLPVLAAHLYYRALLTFPSLVHAWVVDCKDRQLSTTITNYTSLYFSPVIIQTELAHVKSPESATLLVDENFAIKVASAVNEVVASYAVDEHQLEIKLKIPVDWPLHKIEVKDLKRVGVDENRWRAWILAVQQIIWSHNGRIVDGLGLFKKNVQLHFEGQVECAICYSIISVMDGSLPRKPCRTCKNRFHAGCLYKWFNTSHSSSCPLCRSDIF